MHLPFRNPRKDPVGSGALEARINATHRVV